MPGSPFGPSSRQTFGQTCLGSGDSAALGKARPTGRLLAGRVPRSPLRWELTSGPWYDNNLAVLELLPDRLHFRWSRGEIRDGHGDRPTLHRVATVDVPLRSSLDRSGER